MSDRRLLLVMWDGGGTVPPELGLARRLIAAGHEVRVLGDPTLEAEVDEAGCAFSPWTTAPHITSRHRDDALLRDWEHKHPMKGIAAYMEDFLAAPAPRWAADVAAELDARPVDGVLVDAYLPAARIPAEGRGLPVVGILPNCWIVPTKGIPPMGSGFAPATNPFTRTRDALMRSMMTRVFNRALPSVNAVRADHGLPPVSSTHQQMVNGPVLVLTSPVLDFTSPHLPDAVRYVGPVLDDPTWTTEWQSPWGDDDRPLALVSLSSGFQGQVETLNRLVDALVDLPVRALVTLGQAVDPEEVPSRSGVGDVVVVASAPHSAVLPDADMVVSHCGHGTMVKALAAGVPLVCVPMGRDQNDNAARVVQRGAGVRVKPSAPVDAIRAAVQEVLDDPTYRRNAERIASAIAMGEGCVDPVTEIESIVAMA